MKWRRAPDSSRQPRSRAFSIERRRIASDKSGESGFTGGEWGFTGVRFSNREEKRGNGRENRRQGPSLGDNSVLKICRDSRALTEGDSTQEIVCFKHS